MDDAAAFLTQKCALPNRTIKFEIWDTAGQERFASLAPMYYRNAQAALVAYDLTKPSSLVKARHWVAELQRQASPGIVIALAGNKLDLVEENDSSASASEGAATEGDDAAKDGEDEADSGKARKVSTKEAEDFAKEEGLLFFETSAKTGFNVPEVFAKIAESIPESSLKGRGAGAQTQPAAGAAGARGTDAARVDLGRAAERGGAKDSCAC